jgi:hypothetical protein
VLGFFLIWTPFVAITFAGPAFVYVIALGAIVSPSKAKFRPLRRLILFSQVTALFYGFGIAWTAIVTSGLVGEFDVVERRIDPIALLSIALVPILAAIVGRVWVKMRSKSWVIDDAT